MSKNSKILCTILVCVYFWYCFGNYLDWHFIDNVNLIFHEAGHTIFSFFGTFIKVAAGSGLQLAIPLLISIYFFCTGQKLSGALCLLWVGQNLLNISVYAGDAVTMQLDLLGGDSVMHDWNYLLSTLGVLNHTATIAHAIYTAGFITLCGGTALSVYYAVR